MERLGKSFILVLEPLEFNVYEKKMNFDTLGFVFEFYVDLISYLDN